jgi:hypothetical protein
MGAVGIEETCVKYAGSKVDFEGVGEGLKKGGDCVKGAVGVDWAPTVMVRIFRNARSLRGHFAFWEVGRFGGMGIEVVRFLYAQNGGGVCDPQISLS